MAVAKAWTVYLLRCADGMLYCGATTDLPRRVGEHLKGRGRGARYTRSRGPFRVEAATAGLTRAEALRLEAAVKRRPARGKAAFLAGYVSEAKREERGK